MITGLDTGRRSPVAYLSMGGNAAQVNAGQQFMAEVADDADVK
jgi:hypothetical protein